jgi:CRP/FNR family transcriptional regulator, cyclic AMP receptor protein
MDRVTTADKRRLFEAHFLFGKLDYRDLDALLSRARVLSYAAGEEIFAKGSPGRSMMAVLVGSVRIAALSRSGKEVMFNIINAGEIFGEIALLDGRDRTADASALTDCNLLVVDRREVMPILERRADLCITLMEVLCQRLRETSMQLEDALFERLDTRIAKVLMRLMRGIGERGARDPLVPLRLSQQEIAGMVGATRESINKQLHIWQREGVLKVGKGAIVVHDISALKRLI